MTNKEEKIFKILEYLNQGQIRNNQRLTKDDLENQFDFTSYAFDEAFKEIEAHNYIYRRVGTEYIALAHDGEIKFNELKKLKSRQENSEKTPTNDNLEAKPPGFIQNVKWFLVHGRKNWLVILVALVALALYYLYPKITAYYSQPDPLGVFSITFTNRLSDTIRINGPGEFYVQGPKSDGVNQEILSGLIRLESSLIPNQFKVGPSQSVTLRAELANEGRFLQNLDAGEFFCKMIFSAQPRRVTKEIVFTRKTFNSPIEIVAVRPDPPPCIPPTMKKDAREYDHDESKNVASITNRYDGMVVEYPEPTKPQLNKVVYNINFPCSGRYNLRIRFAAKEVRPVTVKFNSETHFDVCNYATGAWDSSLLSNTALMEINVRAGRNKLTISRTGSIPHLHSFTFTPIK